MSLLVAANRAELRAVVERIDGRFSATYVVSLRVGGKFRRETDVKMFHSQKEAGAWLHREAAARDFNSLGPEKL